MSKILFAEDDDAMRKMITAVLESAGHTVRGVSGGQLALAQVRDDTPDLVLLDYRMGHPDGFEVCRRIKSDPSLEHIPVLLLTAEVDVEDRIRGFEAGANDYLAKPFDARELIARVGALVRLSVQGRELNPTTGLPGGAAIEKEFERRRHAGKPFTLCYLDLDYFKPLNDRFGFATANALIEALGAILRKAVTNTTDFAGHIGGDDFVVMCEREAARPLVGRIQRQFAEAVSRVIPAEIVDKGVYRGKLRSGVEEDVPLTRVAAALMVMDPATMPALEKLGELAAEGKGRAKESKSDGIVEVMVGP